MITRFINTVSIVKSLILLGYTVIHPLSVYFMTNIVLFFNNVQFP